MSRLAGLVLGVAACGGGPTKVPASVIDTSVRDNGVDELIRANGDPGALVRLFDTPLEIGGMWFEDPQCRARFATAGVIDAAHSARSPSASRPCGSRRATARTRCPTSAS